ncbi:(2Fe-2S)-binding protein [Marinobacterium nitratireducens]|uniref:(2Fe-2S)-binding protein n=1 Tax=Marinobacterium nitratireducens TaxID=518897 RepID=A0A917ZIV2_9GAMM|nr:Rieske 2Fe-2S domain-containing protein [Marinobacterium nitratireducens]GGO84265.1 (2Fe-2S)-binding protein [Marinobacterium nitratireducens]
MTRCYEIPSEKIPARGSRSLLWIDDGCVALFNVDGELYAIDDSCPHQGASLAGGRLEGRTIQCCAHGLRYDLASGYLFNSTNVRVATYPIERRGDRIYLVLAEDNAP